ncbi:hypothetical protein DFH27DRAFT_613068 [Peziza echinospora]|nr:hypothetical protein DFH27DRAFT_613068 [Peziza echinospora]
MANGTACVRDGWDMWDRRDALSTPAGCQAGGGYIRGGPADGHRYPVSRLPPAQATHQDSGPSSPSFYSSLHASATAAVVTAIYTESEKVRFRVRLLLPEGPMRGERDRGDLEMPAQPSPAPVRRCPPAATLPHSGGFPFRARSESSTQLAPTDRRREAASGLLRSALLLRPSASAPRCAAARCPPINAGCIIYAIPLAGWASPRHRPVCPHPSLRAVFF